MNIGTASVSGLASGLDTQQIIDDLIAVDSKPLTRLESQKTGVTDKSAVFTTMKTDLLELKDKAFEVKSTSTLGAYSASSSDEEALSLNITANAVSGTYSLKILSLAQAETLSGGSFADSDAELGLAGEIMVNGNNVKVRTSDSLIDIRNAINTLDTGVIANVLKVSENDYRLIVAAETQGEQGFIISDVGSADLLGELGFTDGTTAIREIVDGEVLSMSFSSATSTVGSQINLSTVAAGTVKLRGVELGIDLSTDTLASIRDNINALGIPGVTARVDSVTENGSQVYRLAIAGTGEFTDDLHILETLGILAGGTAGTNAEFRTGQLFTGSNGGNPEPTQLQTLLTALGAEVGDTVTISGTDAGGTDVLSTITIGQSTTVGDVIDEIAEAFGGAANVALENGQIVITAAEAGVTEFNVAIATNNESGGTLDFGAVSNSVVGRDRLVVAGANARVKINNIEVSRSSNEINDVINGLTMTLKKADPETTLTVTIEQDDSAVFEKVQDFVDSFNSIATFINQKSSYNAEDETAGPLLGDLTSRSALTRLQNVFQSSINTGLDFTHLAQVGIELTADGTLKIDANRLNEAMDQDIDAVMALFTVTRTASDNDISFVYSSSKTKPGTYDVNITRAAERASVESDAIDGPVGDDGTITVTDHLGNELTVEYTAGMSVGDIADAINDESVTKLALIRRSEAGLTAEDGIITGTTAIGDIAGVSAGSGDTITVSGTDRTGRTLQRTLRLTGPDSHAVGDLLDAIEAAANDHVTASLDAEGRIVVQDRQAGSSKVNVSIASTIEGLDLGDFGVVQNGRNKVNIDAVVTNGRLEIAQEYYGSSKTFSVTGGGALGIADGTFAGVDVAGTINGLAGTGDGRALTVSKDDTIAQGIVVSVALTLEDLTAEGGAQGTVTLVSGVADRLYNEISFLTDPVNGFIQVQLDSLKVETENLNDRIENMNDRIAQKRELYVRRFTEMEKALSLLQSMQQQLTASLNALPQVSLSA